MFYTPKTTNLPNIMHKFSADQVHEENNDKAAKKVKLKKSKLQ